MKTATGASQRAVAVDKATSLAADYSAMSAPTLMAA